MSAIGKFQRINISQIIEAMSQASMSERIRFNDVNLRWLAPSEHEQIDLEDYLDYSSIEPTVKETDQHPWSFYIARIRNGSTFEEIKRDVPSITINHIVACFVHGRKKGLL